MGGFRGWCSGLGRHAGASGLLAARRGSGAHAVCLRRQRGTSPSTDIVCETREVVWVCHGGPETPKCMMHLIFTMLEATGLCRQSVLIGGCAAARTIGLTTAR